MAKQAVSGIERHVEKIVVGLAGAVLIGAIVLYLLESPRKVAVGSSDEKGPGEVHAAVREIADRLEQAIDRAEHPEVPLPNPVDAMAQQRKNPAGNLPLTLASPLPWTMRSVPEVVEGPKLKKIQLASAIAPEDLAVAKGRTTIRALAQVGVNRPSQEGTDEDKVWVAVGGEFDVAKQRQAFLAKGYTGSKCESFISEVLLRRRELLGDGTWGPWEEVKSYSAHQVPPVPEVTASANPNEPLLDSSEMSKLAEFAKLVSSNQDRIARPLPPTVVAGEPWAPPKLKNVDVNAAMKSVEADQPSRSTEKATEQEALRELDLKQEGAIDRAQSQLEDLKKQGRLDQAIDLVSRYQKQLPQLPRLDRTRTTKWLKEYLDGVNKEKEQAAKAGEQKPTSSTDRIAIWAYDTEARPGRTYQYQLAVKLLNLYAGVPELWENPRDAIRMTLDGQWSEVSPLVRAPEITRFFLQKASSPSEASVEVWKWQQGQWHNKRFTVQVGGMIGEKDRDRTAGTEVDYSTEAMVVEVEKERKCRLAALGGVSGGSRGVEESQSEALVYVDASGRMGELLAVLDSTNPWRKERKDELKPARRPRGGATTGF